MKPPTVRPFSQPRFIVTVCAAFMSADNCCAGLPHALITSPAFVVIKASSEFKDKTSHINQMWQTDFTYIKVIGWGWFYLSTILDDFSRYIITWKLCTTMKAGDVTETLELALQASGCDQVEVQHKPRLLSDNQRVAGSSPAAPTNLSIKLFRLLKARTTLGRWRRPCALRHRRASRCVP